MKAPALSRSHARALAHKHTHVEIDFISKLYILHGTLVLSLAKTHTQKTNTKKAVAAATTKINSSGNKAASQFQVSGSICKKKSL